MDNWTAGEAGGFLAAVVAVLTMFGGGIRWLFGWQEGRATTREAKLARWEESLVAREREYRTTMERDFDELKADMARLNRELQTTRSVVVEVTTELRHHAPESEALRRAELLMRSAFPVDYQIPAEHAEAIRRLNGAG